MSTTCMKRLVRERERMPKDSLDFWVNWDDSNLRKFDAYIIGPEDSVYKYKLVKLKFDIPNDYPFVPPKVKFIQHTGDRIHPNLYTEGKVCLSILGTWPGDPWSYSMTIEGCLITIRALLDNKPYLHEPHQGDHPEFNRYVRHNTWRWLLLDYLDREQDPEAKTFLQQYLRKHGAEMLAELELQKYADGCDRPLTSPYKRGISGKPDYNALLAELKKHIFENSKLILSEPTSQVQPLESDGRKRKEPHDTQEEEEPPKYKFKQEPTVIDLTDDP